MVPDKPQRIPLDTADFSSTPPGPAPDLPPEGTAPSSTELTPVQQEEIQEKILTALRGCFDPEIPVNIYELGLIYTIDLQPSGAVAIQMTLTSPACPAAGSLPPDVQRRVRDIPGVTAAKVDVVWEPPWSPDRMSEAAKLQLGIF